MIQLGRATCVFLYILLCYAEHNMLDVTKREMKTKQLELENFWDVIQNLKRIVFVGAFFFRQCIAIFTQCSQIFYSRVVLVILSYLMFWWNLNLKNSRLMVLINLHSCSRFLRTEHDKIFAYFALFIFIFFNHDLFIIKRYHNHFRNYEFLA